MTVGRPVVLDSSVLVGLVLQDETWHLRAHVVLRDVAMDLLQPTIAPNARFEIRNALVSAARRRRIAWEDVPRALVIIDELRLPVSQIDFRDADLLALCRKHGLAWGDAHHVFLAQRTRAALLTADVRLVRTLAHAPVWVECIADRPMS